jgi:hypothetical protein
MNNKGDLGLLGFDLHLGDCLDVMKSIPDNSVDRPSVALWHNSLQVGYCDRFAVDVGATQAGN